MIVGYAISRQCLLIPQPVCIPSGGSDFYAIVSFLKLFKSTHRTKKSEHINPQRQMKLSKNNLTVTHSQISFIFSKSNAAASFGASCHCKKIAKIFKRLIVREQSINVCPEQFRMIVNIFFPKNFSRSYQAPQIVDLQIFV